MVKRSTFASGQAHETGSQTQKPGGSADPDDIAGHCAPKILWLCIPPIIALLFDNMTSGHCHDELPGCREPDCPERKNHYRIDDDK
jgi:hypothetical protein